MFAVLDQRTLSLQPQMAVILATLARQPKDGDQNEGCNAMMSSADLRAELKRAKERPASCAIGLTKAGQSVMLVQRLRRPRKLLANLKTQAKSENLDLNLTSLRFGRVSATEAGPVAITLNKDVPPATEHKLKPIMRAAGHPAFTINADPSIESEPDDDAPSDPPNAVFGPLSAPTAPPVVSPGPTEIAASRLHPPGSDDPASIAPAPPRAPLSGIIPPDLAHQIKTALETEPSRKPALAKLLAQIRAASEAGDLDATTAATTALHQALDAPGTPAPANRQPWPTQPGAARQGGAKSPAAPQTNVDTAPDSPLDDAGFVIPVRFPTPNTTSPISTTPPPELRPPAIPPPSARLPSTPPPALAAPAMRVISGMTIAVVGGALANELNTANFDGQIMDVLKQPGLDPTKPADVKAAQAYVFVRILAPARFQFWSVPSQDPGNMRVAKAVLKAVQADPDLLDHAPEQDQAAKTKLEAVIQTALGTSTPPQTGTGGNTSRTPPRPPENVRQDGECDEHTNLGSTSPRPNLPRSDGTWQNADGTPGSPGDSLWFSNKPDVQAITGGRGIQFINGRPDFTPWAKLSINLPYGELIGKNSLDADKIYSAMSRADPATFPTPDEAEDWADKQHLTPHHALDTCIQLVPQELNAMVPHIGSAADLRSSPPNTGNKSSSQGRQDSQGAQP